MWIKLLLESKWEGQSSSYLFLEEATRGMNISGSSVKDILD